MKPAPNIDVFIKTDKTVVHVNDITYINYDEIDTSRTIHIYSSTGDMHTASGILAIEALMKLMPSALEGKRLRWNKLDWLFHNIVAHPLMQIVALFGMYRLAFWIHDSTIPTPKGFKEQK